MRKSLLLIVLAAATLFVFSSANAAMEVKLSGRLYAHWYYDLSDTLNAAGNISDVDFKSYSTFGISRAYLTGLAKLSEKTSGKITFDINPTNVEPYVRLKFAYFRWNFYNSTQLGLGAKFGLHETPWNNGIEQIWGRRYLAKVPADQLSMETTSDLGVSLIGDLGEKAKWGWASLSIFDGTSYTDVRDNNPTKDINLAAFITPLSGNPDFAMSTVGFQYYAGTLNAYSDSGQTKGDYKKTLMSFVANCQYKKIVAVGVEYDNYKSKIMLGTTNTFWLNAQDQITENKATALALFGTLWFAELAKDTKFLQPLDIFFRYLTVNQDGSNLLTAAGAVNKSNELIFGLECVPVEGFAAAINYRSDTQKHVGPGVSDLTNSYLFLNTLVEF